MKINTKSLCVAFIEYNKIEPSTGIGNVCLHLRNELQKFEDIRLVLIPPPYKLPGKYIAFKLINKIVFAFWYALFVPLYSKIKGVDIYIEMNMIFPLLRFTQFYFFIYDLAFEKFPSTVLKKNYKRRISFLSKINLATDKVFVISQSTKNDFNTFKQNSDSSNVFVVPLASSLNVIKTNVNYVIPGRYFLYVGTLEPRKNLVNIINGYYRFLDASDSNINFVLVGKKGWLADDIIETINGSEKYRNRVIIKGYLDDITLSSVYKNAFALVYVSLYEGFGLPILEAMKHGVPVITAMNSSLPEIGGDAVLYTGTEAVDIMKTMLTLYNDQGLQKALVQKGFKQAGLFSWEIFGEAVHDKLVH